MKRKENFFFLLSIYDTFYFYFCHILIHYVKLHMPCILECTYYILKKINVFNFNSK